MHARDSKLDAPSGSVMNAFAFKAAADIRQFGSYGTSSRLLELQQKK
jgi:hypothetical protein